MNFEPIGFIETDFKEKFGIPRQPGLVKNARGVVRLNRDTRLNDSVRGLEGFSHLWLIWVFHQTGSGRWKPMIRPPRLGGVKKMGVLASRSPHRPNPIGLSVVKIEEIRRSKKGQVEIVVSGVDILDGTPVLDIKPYVPYADSVRGAKAGWAQEKLVFKKVSFSKLALRQIAEIEAQGRKGFKKFVRDFLGHDPRPAFQHKIMHEGAEFGVHIADWDFKFEVRDGGFWVSGLDAPRERKSK